MNELQTRVRASFLLVELSTVEYCRSRESLGSWPSLERLMMKSSTLFECGPLPMSTSCPPDVIHVIGVPRPSPFFATLPLPCILLNANWRTKTGEAWEWGYSVQTQRLWQVKICPMFIHLHTQTKADFPVTFAKLLASFLGPHPASRCFPVRLSGWGPWNEGRV